MKRLAALCLALPAVGFLLASALLVSCQAPSEDSLEASFEVVPFGNREVVLMPDGSLQPYWIGAESQIGLCVEVPIAVDSSQWQAQFNFGQISPRGYFQSDFQSDFQSVFVRSGSSLCFKSSKPQNFHTTQHFELCATIRDGFDQRGQRFRLPCIEGRFDAEDADFLEFERRAQALQSFSESTRDTVLADRTALAVEASEQDFPLVGLYLELITVYQLRRLGTETALDEVARRLEQLPPWLDQPAALPLQVTAIYERAMLALARRQLSDAWRHLAHAESEVERFAGAQRTVIALQQAEILNQIDAGHEAMRRLQAVLDDDQWPSHPHYAPVAHALLAWLLTIDPESGAEELKQASHHLEAAAPENSVVRDAAEQADFHIQQALLEARVGGDFNKALARARDLLEPLEANARSRLLTRWADVVEGQCVLENNQPARALDLCSRATSTQLPRLSGIAWSCVGKAHRQLGELQAAQDAFDQALVRHELSTPDLLGQDLPLAPSQRADDYYRAARVAIERGDPDRAWRTLHSLDLLAPQGPTGCTLASSDVTLRLEQRRLELWQQLALTEPPFSEQRRQQLGPLRSSILEALEELHGMLLVACRGEPAITGAPDFRAFALPDEVILLHRTSGQIRLVARTEMPRKQLRRQLEQIATAQSTGNLDDEKWRQLVRPLSPMLLPATGGLPRISRFALHGILQRAPLAALPLEAPEGVRWLGELTTPVLTPAYSALKAVPDVKASHVEASDVATIPGSHVFVVDPQRNLPSGLEARDLYRELFPEATVLYGKDANRARVLDAASQASFLHFDAHGNLDAAFPRLSGLSLADGPLTVADFLTLPRPRQLINLSGCQTARSRETADSGRYGFAGTLIGLGVPWVVATGAVVEDRLVQRFNGSFYRHLFLGRSIPASFAAAHRQLRAHYPAASWSNLILLGQPADPEQTPSHPTHEVDDEA